MQTIDTTFLRRCIASLEVGPFSRLVAPLFARVRHNADRSRLLAALRYTLFPKLISGELRVPAADREPTS